MCDGYDLSIASNFGQGPPYAPAGLASNAGVDFVEKEDAYRISSTEYLPESEEDSGEFSTGGSVLDLKVTLTLISFGHKTGPVLSSFKELFHFLKLHADRGAIHF